MHIHDDITLSVYPCKNIESYKGLSVGDIIGATL